MDSDTQINIKKRAVLLSLSVGILMFVGKVAAYLITGSSAILSDAMESVIHIVASAFVFYSMMQSLKPANADYPYGYGKIEYFSSGIEGFLIVVAAVAIIFYAVYDIINGPQVEQLDLGLLIISSAAAINLFLGLYLIRQGKKTKSLILIADGKHILTDSYTSLGVIIGIGLVYFTGEVLFDPAFAILLALNILFIGRKLIRESIDGLMNRSNKKITLRIAERINFLKDSYEDWIDIHLFRFWRSGSNYFADLHCAVPKYSSVELIHEYEEIINNLLKEEFDSENVEIKIHWDPCTPVFCKYCRKNLCEIRTDMNIHKFDFSLNKIVGKPIYNYIE